MSSREMIEAMIAGERDSKVLAEMATSRLGATIPQLDEAFSGHFGAHHAIVARQIIDHIDFLDRSIAVLADEITTRLVPFEAAVAIVTSIPGISEVTAQVIVAETGADMSRFRTPEQLCTGQGSRRPAESAGKRRPAGTRHGAPWLRRTLIEAARAASRTKASYYHAQYTRIAKRRGPNKAAVAVANSLLFTIWHLLSSGAFYQDPGGDYFERRHDPVVEATRLTRRIEALGFDVDLTQKAA
jgi:transposase